MIYESAEGGHYLETSKKKCRKIIDKKGLVVVILQTSNPAPSGKTQTGNRSKLLGRNYQGIAQFGGARRLGRRGRRFKSFYPDQVQW